MDQREALVSVGPRRRRYLIDIVVLVAVTFVLDAGVGAFMHEDASRFVLFYFQGPPTG